MARFILEAAGEDITVGGTDVNVYGTSAGGEVITVVGGDVTLDASFALGGDTIELPGEAEEYTVTLSGSRVILTNGTISVSIPVGTAGLAVDFGGDDTRIVRVENGAVLFGEQTVTATETTLDPGSDDLTIVEALAALQAAQQALSEFETENDTAANLRSDLTADQAALASARSTRSDAQLAADVVSANADVAAAQTDVNAVAGLADAIEDLAAAEAEVEATAAALAEAQAVEAGAKASYNARPSADITTDTLELASDGTWTGGVFAGATALIVVDTVTGQPRLADNITETTNPGITAVLNAVVATETAEVDAQAAIDARDDAQDEVDQLDVNAGLEADAEADIEDFDAAVASYNSALAAYVAGNTVSEANLVSAYNELLANGVSDVVDDTDNSGVADADEIAADSAVVQTAIEVREDDLDAALEAAIENNPLVGRLELALQTQEVREKAVADRDELIQNVADAQDLVDQVTELEDAITDAQDAVVDLGYALPVNVDGAEAGTAGNDIFLFVNHGGSIADFGAEGDDILFIGTGYTAVELAADVDLGATNQGDVGALEVFIQQDGANTVLYFEDVTFAGSTTNGFSGYTVTLTGVDASTVSFDATGYITIEDATVA